MKYPVTSVKLIICSQSLINADFAPLFHQHTLPKGWFWPCCPYIWLCNWTLNSFLTFSWRKRKWSKSYKFGGVREKWSYYPYIDSCVNPHIYLWYTCAGVEPDCLWISPRAPIIHIQTSTWFSWAYSITGLFSSERCSILESNMVTWFLFSHW